MASNNFQICSRCYCSREKSLFVSKNGRQLKSCKNCRDQSSDIYATQKSGQNNHETDETDEISPSTMQEMIFDKVASITQNDVLESEHLGLDFTCVISTNLLEGTLQKKTKQIIEMITKGNGYHYI
jgi:hypothetical protein